MTYLSIRFVGADALRYLFADALGFNSRMAYLNATGEEFQGSFELPQKPRRLGRAHDCDIVVNHPSVSRHHCLVTESVDGLRVEDLGSTYGTFVNGEQITDCLAKLGDEIKLGRISFIYDLKPSAMVAVTPLPIVEEPEGETRWFAKATGDVQDEGIMEHTCHSCGASIPFPTEGLGQKIDCAACGQALVLGAVVAKKRQRKRAESVPAVAPKETSPAVMPVVRKRGLQTAALLGITSVVVAAGVGIWFFNRGAGSTKVVANEVEQSAASGAETTPIIDSSTNEPKPVAVTNAALPVNPEPNPTSAGSETTSNVVASVTNIIETNAVAVAISEAGPPPPNRPVVEYERYT